MLLADMIDVLGVVLPVVAVAVVATIFLTTKWGRGVLKRSFKSGQRFGDKFAGGQRPEDKTPGPKR